MVTELLNKKNHALEAAVWPLGRPDNAHEIPMWQEICAKWVERVMKPVHVTYLIDELLEMGKENADSIANDIRQAIANTGNWEYVLSEAGWILCDDLASALEAGDRSNLVKLINLALDGAAAEEPSEDSLYFWVRRNPKWKDGDVVFEDELLDWEQMLDARVRDRIAGDSFAERETGTAAEYVLGSIMWSDTHAQMKSTDPDATKDFMSLDGLSELPKTKFCKPKVVFDKCAEAVAAWVISEWLRTNGFVNFDQDDWSSQTTWQELGKELDDGTGVIEEKISRNEIAQWYLVSETAGELLKNVGEPVIEVDGTAYVLWGRDEGGQVLHFDGAVQRAIVLSGYVDRIPPLGALNRGVMLPQGLKVSLGRDEYPLRLEGYSAVQAVLDVEARSLASAEAFLIDPQYRELGWRIEWGPHYESADVGPVYTFRLTNKPAPEVETFFVVAIKIKAGEYEFIKRVLVPGVDEQAATKAAILNECCCSEGKGMSWEGDNAWDCHGELFYSVKSLTRVDPEHVEIMKAAFLS